MMRMTTEGHNDTLAWGDAVRSTRMEAVLLGLQAGIGGLRYCPSRRLADRLMAGRPLTKEASPPVICMSTGTRRHQREGRPRTAFDFRGALFSEDASDYMVLDLLATDLSGMATSCGADVGEVDR